MTRRANPWLLGWLAAADVVARRGEDVLTMELLTAAGIDSLAQLDSVRGLEQYDRDALAATVAFETIGGGK